MSETRTKLYFAIKTEDEALDLDAITAYIDLVPTKFEKMLSRGHFPKCTIWEYARPEFTNWDIESELNELVQIMQPFGEGLIRLKKDFDVHFVIQLVLYLGTDIPALHFGSMITHFAAQIDAEIDCDMYHEQ